MGIHLEPNFVVFMCLYPDSTWESDEKLPSSDLALSWKKAFGHGHLPYGLGARDVEPQFCLGMQDNHPTNGTAKALRDRHGMAGPPRVRCSYSCSQRGLVS